MTIITKDNFKSEVEDFSGLAVIDLYADWCGPCRMLAPVLDELEGEFPEVKFCKINVDNEPELAKAFNVKNIPMVALVKDNTFVDMSIGYVPKENLKKLIEEYR
ncbi:MAG: thioredoxin [Clostridia bacterium]|nr:thioredoxin [Clostridia bacterium]